MYGLVRTIVFICFMLYYRGDPPKEYSAFLRHSFNVFKVGLDRELYRQEQELTVCASPFSLTVL